MLPCSGCKHLINTPIAMCSALDPGLERVANPYTGHLEWQLKEGKYRLRPYVVDMRRPDHECGPDRKLYEPSAWTRFKEWAFK